MNSTLIALVNHMSRKADPPHDNPEQSRRFIEVAREIGADQEAPDFDKVLGRVAESIAPETKARKKPTARQK